MFRGIKVILFFIFKLKNKLIVVLLGLNRVSGFKRVYCFINVFFWEDDNK